MKPDFQGFSNFSLWPLPVEEDLCLLYETLLSSFQSQMKGLEL